MTDIFQEVEEDLRRERLKRIWDRYGIFVLVAAVLIVIVTAGWRGYDAWNTSQQRAAGDAFVAALTAAEATQTAGAAEQLVTFAEDAPAGFGMLAKFRAATTYNLADQPDEAVAILRSLTTDSSIDSVYQDLARTRLAQVLIDGGSYDEAKQTLSPVAEDASNPFNKSAQEMMGLASYAAGDMAEARRWFTAVESAAGTPPGLRARARFMLALLVQTDDSAGAQAAVPSAEPEETN
ncbi:MAG: tetratricopeptide repeat protein [Pseudomonadota bacterium]